ncbi:hypothetical protein BASA82_000687 [Batrachochytrium salamandrivorans]|nr:hypothetical protein BASA81_004077 [Batrachochytrium salamandrivorans]KAH9262276.1 hypothetical protein BASA82_000687 [Batrachochytrium salamandrivorans]
MRGKKSRTVSLLWIMGGGLLFVVWMLRSGTHPSPQIIAPLRLASPTTSSPFSEYGTTIVTCFFDVSKVGQKTKHPASFYLQTGTAGVLGIKSPMVIFTDSPNDVAKARKYPELTRIVTVSIKDFQAYQRHFERMQVLFKRDSEGMGNKYSALLFTIYHVKPELMNRAAELDYFHTDKYIYMDVGAIRDWGGIVAADYVDKRYPAPDREWLIGREDRVQLQGTATFKSACEANVRWVEAESPNQVKDVANNKHPDAILVEPTVVHWWIAGSIFSGNKVALTKYAKAYYVELQRYLDADYQKYSLIDQFLMGAMACRYDFVEVVRPPRKCCEARVNRQWFFLLMFYKNATYPQTPYSHEEMVARGMIKA